MKVSDDQVEMLVKVACAAYLVPPDPDRPHVTDFPTQMRQALSAALAVLPQQETTEGWQWQPIETAPENRPVLLRWTYWSALPVNGILKNGRWEAAEALTEGPGPTHWSPFPALPASPAQESP